MQNHPKKADVSIDSTKYDNIDNYLESPKTPKIRNVHSNSVKTALSEVLDIQSKLRMSVEKLIAVLEDTDSRISTLESFKQCQERSQRNE